MLTWTIISDHVFFDANKRTGIAVLKTFLRVNGYSIVASDDELIEVAEEIANKEEQSYTIDDFTKWVRANLRVRPLV